MIAPDRAAKGSMNGAVSTDGLRTIAPIALTVRTGLDQPKFGCDRVP